MNEEERMIQELREAVLGGSRDRVGDIVSAALESGLGARRLMDEGLIPAMDRVGKLYDRKEYFVPEVLLSATAMKDAMSVLRPALSGQGVEPAGRVVIGTVRGDVHDIGKNIVSLVLEGAGFQVADLGSDVPSERFARAVRETGAGILAMSAMLTTTRGSMAEVLSLIASGGMRGSLRVIVGGAAVSPDFAREVGADAYGEDAVRAVDLARGAAGSH